MNHYKGKTAVISGGAEGIGFSIAEALGHQGMNLVLGDINQEKLSQAQTKLQQQGFPVATQKMDVAAIDDWHKLADTAVNAFGKMLFSSTYHNTFLIQIR